jgi:hypothetical protein
MLNSLSVFRSVGDGTVYCKPPSPHFLLCIVGTSPIMHVASSFLQTVELSFNPCLPRLTIMIVVIVIPARVDYQFDQCLIKTARTATVHTAVQASQSQGSVELSIISS